MKAFGLAVLGLCLGACGPTATEFACNSYQHCSGDSQIRLKMGTICAVDREDAVRQMDALCTCACQSECSPKGYSCEKD